MLIILAHLPVSEFNRVFKSRIHIPDMDGWMAHHEDGCRQVPEAHATMAKGCLK